MNFRECWELAETCPIMENTPTKFRPGPGTRTDAPVRPESGRGFKVGDRVNVKGFETGIIKYIGAVHFKVSSVLLKYERLFYRQANRLLSTINGIFEANMRGVIWLKMKRSSILKKKAKYTAPIVR